MIGKLTKNNFFFGILGVSTILCLILSAIFESFALSVIPLVVLIGLSFILDFKSYYYILFASIPLCIEWEIPGGFSTDLPTEPLCILLMAATFYYLINKWHVVSFEGLKSPLVTLIFILLGWSAICIFSSKVPIVSIKYVLSKIWYIATYLILTILIVNNPFNLKKLFWAIFVPLFFTVAYSFIRHAMNGFSFELMNEPSLPFYRNHVMYAATITVFYPFIYLAKSWYKPRSFLYYFLGFNQLFFLIAIYFTYTRACILALGVGFVFYFIIKHKRVKESLGALILGLSVFLIIIVYQNNYLKFAPEFSNTIYHDSYDNHIEATFEGHDASSMERINMWIGAVRMFPHYPIFGVGPGNFFPFYKSYTVVHYHTWVSDNELRLSCHNYFLLLLAEQGLPGCLLFIILSIMIFVFIEKQYALATNSEERKILLCLGVAFVILYVNLTLSDLIETAKIGSLFYMMIGLLINTKLKCFNQE